MELAFIAIVLFVMLMFTRRRLTAVEERARQLRTDLDNVIAEALHRERRVEQLAAELARRAAEPAPVEPTEYATPAPPPTPAAVAVPDAREAFAAPAVQAAAPPRAAAAPPAAPEPAPLAATSTSSATPHGPPPLAAPPTAGGVPIAGWAPPSGPQPESPPDPLSVATHFLRDLLFGGNTVVRIGIFVLLVGLVLLLRWGAEHGLFPIELRLAGAALLAIALIVVGYRQREARPGFARTLQGGGIAAVYLVVFFAYRSYGLLPAPLAFGLLAAVALSSGVLALAQDSLSLIMIAQLFGFLAPLLASTGKGSHVGLFSYYLLLNIVIGVVAWFRAWRALNLLGFAFTFGVASAWGVLRYEPEHFASTEPFLIAFFLLYVALPVLFTLRHPQARRGWVDGSLVFGTPLAALGLQWAMVHDMPFAMAYSALGLAAVYIGLASWIKRRAAERLIALGEAFLPIGAGFVTLAIPYALDDHNLTGAAWAIEGAGLYWIGVRQKRWLSRIAGFLLQFLAGGALAFDPHRPVSSLPLLNSWFLAGTLLGMSSLFVAAYGYRARVHIPREWRFAQILIAWGLLFVLGAGFGEIDARVSETLRPGVQIAWSGAVALVLELVAGRVGWLPGRYPALLLWLAMIGFVCRHHFDYDVHQFARGGFIGWPLYALAMATVLRRFVPEGPAFLRYAHPAALWLWTLWAVTLTDQLVADQAGLDRNYVMAASLAVMVAVVLGVLAASLTPRPRWPFAAAPALYAREGAGVIVAGLLLRVLQANSSQPGASAPIPYLPVANALDLTLLLACAAAAAWVRRGAQPPPGGSAPLVTAEIRRMTTIVLAGLAFVCWNGLLARTVHHYGGVPYRADALWNSIALQVAFSLSWTLIALALMIFAHRRRVRVAWWVGAGLLAVVVGKLFLLDLAELSAPAKIGTFIGVGLLLLLVGAVAPVPPAAAARPTPPADDPPKDAPNPEVPT